MIASNEHKYDEKPYHGGGVLMDGAGCHVAPTACRASTSFPQAVSSSFEHETVWGVPSAAVKVRSMQASFRTLTTLQATTASCAQPNPRAIGKATSRLARMPSRLPRVSVVTQAPPVPHSCFAKQYANCDEHQENEQDYACDRRHGRWKYTHHEGHEPVSETHH